MKNSIKRMSALCLRKNILPGFFRRVAVLNTRSELQPFVVAVGDSGARFLANPNFYIDSTMLKTGMWEPEISKVLFQLAEENPAGTFWDVGAASGFHSINLKFSFPNLNILAFEPSIAMCKYLYENSKFNGADIVILPVALDHETKMCDFYFATTSNPGLSSLKVLETHSSRQERVMSFSGDSLIELYKLTPPNFIKIDTEGTTLRTLNGMERILINSQAPKLIIECFPEEHDGTWDYLRRCGYMSFEAIDKENNYLVSK